MSQSQNDVSCAPKKFLKKGEGLKRFAAYKPPLPKSAIKRRQTFVKFKLDTTPTKSDFLPPELLDESINLTTKVPKIAPPKIMHTPIRPALARLKPSIFMNEENKHFKTPTLMNDENNHFKTPIFMTEENNQFKTPICINRESKQFKTPIFMSEEPKQSKSRTSFDEGPKKSKSATLLNEESNQSEPKRYNLRRKQTNIENVKPEQPRKSKRQIKAVVERHISQPEEIDKVSSSSDIDANMDNLMKKIEHKKTLLGDSSSEENQRNDELNNKGDEEDQKEHEENQEFSNKNVSSRLRRQQESNLSSPSSGTILIAFGQQLEEIHKVVNELQNKINGIKQTTPPQPSNSTKRTTRSKKSNRQTSNTSRLSANADNLTPRKIEDLKIRVAHVEAWFEKMNI